MLYKIEGRTPVTVSREQHFRVVKKDWLMDSVLVLQHRRSTISPPQGL